MALGGYQRSPSTPCRSATSITACSRSRAGSSSPRHRCQKRQRRLWGLVGERHVGEPGQPRPLRAAGPRHRGRPPRPRAYPAAASASRKTTGSPAARACATTGRGMRDRALVHPPQHGNGRGRGTTGRRWAARAGSRPARSSNASASKPACRLDVWLSTSARTAVSCPRSETGTCGAHFSPSWRTCSNSAGRVQLLQPRRCGAARRAGCPGRG